MLTLFMHKKYNTLMQNIRRKGVLLIRAIEKRIEKHVDFFALREEIRKVGVNFITAGIVVYLYTTLQVQRFLLCFGLVSGLLFVVYFVCYWALLLGVIKRGYILVICTVDYGYDRHFFCRIFNYLS